MKKSLLASLLASLFFAPVMAMANNVEGECIGIASYNSCVVFGLDSSGGNNSVAIGQGATASDTGVAVGYKATNESTWSTALGWSATTTSNSAVAIGAQSSAAGMAVALGRYANAGATNSVAIGYGSVATDLSTVSVGNSTLQRRIVNVGTGKDAFDAVNVSQLQNAISAAIDTANLYTDNKVASIPAPTPVVEDTAAREQGDKDTLDAANNYTDTQSTNEAAARQDGDDQTLNSSNNYTDSQISSEATARQNGDQQTLKSANDYTDRQITTEATARQNGDAQTLESANSYTNEKFAQLGQGMNQLSERIDRNRKRADAGVAGAMAMTAIPMVDNKQSSFGMAMSGYRDQGAIAAGFGFRTSASSAVKVNVSWDSQSGTGVAAGLALGW